MHLVKNEIAIYTKLVKHDNLIESTTLLLQTDPRITFLLGAIKIYPCPSVCPSFQNLCQ